MGFITFSHFTGLNEELSHFDLELPQLLNRLPRNLVGSLTEFFGTFLKGVDLS